MQIKNKLQLKTFEDIPSIIENYIRSIPDEYIDRKRNSETWTIREHLYHIANVQEMLLNRMKLIQQEESPVIKPFFPENIIDTGLLFESMDKAFEMYHRFRKMQIDFINTLNPADFEKNAQHEEYIQYNIPSIIHHMIFHEYWHMHRIEELWLTKDEYFK